MAPKVTITVALNQKPAIEGLKILADKFKASATDINQSLEILKKGWSLVSTGVKAFTGAVVELIKKGEEADRVERRAIAAMRLRGAVTAESFKHLKTFNQGLTQLTGTSSTNLLKVQALLSTYGVMPNKLEAATKATIGYADATGKGLPNAALVVARALNGKTKALERVGIFAKNANDAERRLGEMFQVTAAQSDTLGTRYAVLQANLTAYNKAQAKAVAQSGALKGAVDAISEAIRNLDNFFATEAGKTAVNEFFGTISRGAADLIRAFLGAKMAARELVEAMRPKTESGSNWAAALSLSAPLPGFIKKRLLQWSLQAQDPNAKPEGESSLDKTLSDLADNLTAASNRKVEDSSRAFGGRTGKGGGRPKDKAKAWVDPLSKLSPAAQGMLELGEGRSKKLQDEFDIERTKQTQIEEQRKDYADQLRIAEIERETGQHSFMQELRQKQYDERSKQAKAFYGGLASTSLNGLIGVGEAIISGQGNALAALGQLFAGLLDQTGDFLMVQGGASEVAASLLAFFGIPGVGLGAIAAGIALKVAAGVARAALASSMSDSSQRGGSSRGPRSRADTSAGRGGQIAFSGPRRSSNASGVSDGFTQLDTTSGGAGRVTIVNFGRGVIVGTPHQTARAIKDILAGRTA